jgi:ankyrin repeat protein
LLVLEWYHTSHKKPACFQGGFSMSTDDLIDAASRGDSSAVEALLARGDEVNARTKTKLLFRRSANKGATALIIASSNGHVDVVRTLLNKGAGIDLGTDKGATALMVAAEQGNLEVVRALLDKGAAVNVQDKDGATALMTASSRGRIQVVQALLDKGAEVNLKTHQGATALIWASAAGDLEVVRTLLDKGAEVDAATKYSITALMVGHGNLEVVRVLLDKGAALNARDYEGKTALMKSSWEGQLKVVETLINRGADLSVKDNHRMTALMAVKDTFLSKPKVTESALEEGTLKAAEAKSQSRKISGSATTTKRGRTFNFGGFLAWMAIMLFMMLKGRELLLVAQISGRNSQGDPIALILLIIGIPVSFFLLSFKKRQ